MIVLCPKEQFVSGVTASSAKVNVDHFDDELYRSLMSLQSGFLKAAFVSLGKLEKRSSPLHHYFNIQQFYYTCGV